MTDQRKATDILLDMEERLNIALKMISNLDMNMKIVVNRLNQQSNIQPGQTQPVQFQTPISNLPSLPQPEDKQVIETSPEDIVGLSEKPIKSARSPRSSVDTNNIEVKSGKKVPVQQRLVDQNGKDLFLAELQIMDVEKKNLIAKVRTNAAGKWQAALQPGRYSIQIVKTDSSTKKKYEATNDVNIPNIDAVFTLPTFIMPKQ